MVLRCSAQSATYSLPVLHRQDKRTVKLAAPGPGLGRAVGRGMPTLSAAPVGLGAPPAGVGMPAPGMMRPGMPPGGPPPGFGMAPMPGETEKSPTGAGDAFVSLTAALCTHRHAATDGHAAVNGPRRAAARLPPTNDAASGRIPPAHGRAAARLRPAAATVGLCMFGEGEKGIKQG